MATLLAALAGCLWWYIDVIVCFLVSSSILTFTAIVLVFVYKHFAEPVVNEDESIRNIMKRYGELNYMSRSVLASSPWVVFGLAVLWRVWDIVMNDSTQVQCPGEELILLEDEDLSGVMLSDIMPTWFLPFWIYRDYELHIAVVPLRLTKMLFISAILLSIPLMLAGFYYYNSDEPVLKVIQWLIKTHERWSKSPCGNHLQRIIQLEWAEEQYMKTIIKATVECLDKEKEVKRLEQKIRQLESNIMEVNQWVNSERRLANNFDRKNREVEKKLQVEKKRSVTLESRCVELAKELEEKRRDNAILERKIQEQQRKVAEMEKRPPVLKVVKQQVTGDEIMCVICMERKRQYLLRPCNHYCVCNTCKSTLQNKCPLCRKLIRNYEKIYIS